MNFKFTYGTKVIVNTPNGFYDQLTGTVIGWQYAGSSSDYNIMPLAYQVKLDHGGEQFFEENQLQKKPRKARRLMR